MTVPPLSQAIVYQHQETIEKIIHFYSEFNLPACIQIETGTYDKLIITPVSAINTWMKDRLRKKIDGMNREEFFAYFLNPYTLCERMFDKKNAYREFLDMLSPGGGLIAIDYESKNIRGFFEPIFFCL